MTADPTPSALPVLLDVNVLLALSWTEHVHHEVALDAFDRVEQWATTPVTESGLVRLLLTEPVLGQRVFGAQAIAQVMSIREAPGWSWLPDNSSFSATAINTSVLHGRRQVTDLHLLNLAASNGHRLATFDAGMADWLVPEDRVWLDIWSS